MKKQEHQTLLTLVKSINLKQIRSQALEGDYSSDPVMGALHLMEAEVISILEEVYRGFES